MRYFVASTEEGIGKTVVCAILVQSLTANYWKPIQAGNIKNTDSQRISDLVSKRIIIYPEVYKLSQSVDLYNTSKKENQELTLKDLIPPTSTKLIIEGTGNALTLIDNKGNYITDMLHYCNAEVLLVTSEKNFDKTITALEHLQTKNYYIKGIITIGEFSKGNEVLIKEKTGVSTLFNVPITNDVSKSFVKEQASLIKKIINTQ